MTFQYPGACINHYWYNQIDKRHQTRNTRYLTNIMENNMSNSTFLDETEHKEPFTFIYINEIKQAYKVNPFKIETF
jgi:hypothetical protein